MLKLDLVQTLAFAGVVLFLGYGVRRILPFLARYNIPAPVIGGLLVAVAMAAAHSGGGTVVEFDTTLRTPLMVAFFTSIGYAASLQLLRVGGPQVLLFFGVATVFAVVQNVIGMLIAIPFGLHPLFGVLVGSVTLTGGPATGLAFAPEFEAAGVQGATAVAVAAAMVGIVAGGLVGAPVATRLIERHRLLGTVPPGGPVAVPQSPEDVMEAQSPEPAAPRLPEGEDESSFLLLRSVVLILVAMWLGSYVSTWLTGLGVTLPAYIGAMLVAAVIRNIDDVTGWFGVSQATIDDLGNVALALFITLALMTLQLWEIAGLALPMLVILVVQVAVIALVCFWPIFPMMGKDYDAAVMSGGWCGFMLGTTANAMANMRSLVERYGPAPRAFLVVPMVGAFFIDFTNALIITGILNFFR
jgi:glutamate:Na+ symporter, ESS family